MGVCVFFPTIITESYFSLNALFEPFSKPNLSYFPTSLFPPRSASSPPGSFQSPPASWQYDPEDPAAFPGHPPQPACPSQPSPPLVRALRRLHRSLCRRAAPTTPGHGPADVRPARNQRGGVPERKSSTRAGTRIPLSRRIGRGVSSYDHAIVETLPSSALFGASADKPCSMPNLRKSCSKDPSD